MNQVSVIVPTRNRAALLRTTLRSVLWQRGVDLEVLVVDEASTDGTSAVVAALGDSRIRVLRHDVPKGVAVARNSGALAASGEWLAFLDDDDLWAPEKIVQQVQAAEGDGRDWAYAGAVVINADGQVVRAQHPLPPEEVVQALLRYDAIPGGGSNVVMRRTTWHQVGPFDTRLRNTEDWEMWIRLAKHGPPAWVSRPLIARRLHAANATLDVEEIMRGTRLIQAWHHTTADWGRLHRWMAHSSLRAGRRRTAFGQFARAAAHGRGLDVGRDLTALLRERLGRPTATATPKDAWLTEAEKWLQTLTETDRRP